MNLDSITYQSYEAMCQAAQTYQGEGWTILPCDNPEEGVVGFLAWKPLPPNHNDPSIAAEGSELGDGSPIEEEQFQLQWYPYGELVTEKRIFKNAEEFETTVQNRFAEKPIYRCDDPKKLLAGYVCYGAEPGKALVLQIPITKLKGNRAIIERWQHTPQAPHTHDFNAGLPWQRASAL